jgi:hypothetical protein
MANSDRKIIRGVRLESKEKTYGPGMEDELDALLNAAEVQRLKDKGYLEGQWSGVGPAPKAEKPAKEK